MLFPKAYLKDVRIEVTYSLAGKSVTCHLTNFQAVQPLAFPQDWKVPLNSAYWTQSFLYRKLGESFSPGF